MYGRHRFSAGSPYTLTPMVKRLLIANGIVYLLQLSFPGLTDFAGVSNERVFQGFLWQPFTYMWLHSPGHLMHILFNMFALWMFGGQLEQVWGSRRFLRFYLVCGVGAGFVILLWNYIAGVGYTGPPLSSPRVIPTIGASGAIYGLLMAFSLSWPDRTIMLLFPPIPIKAIWFIPFLFVMQLIAGGEGISHAGHLGGVIVAALLMRGELQTALGGGFGLRSLRYRWHRYRMRGRLRSVRREEWERRRRKKDDDRPTFH